VLFLPGPPAASKKRFQYVLVCGRFRFSGAYCPFARYMLKHETFHIFACLGARSCGTPPVHCLRRRCPPTNCERGDLPAQLSAKLRRADAPRVPGARRRG